MNYLRLEVEGFPIFLVWDKQGTAKELSHKEARMSSSKEVPLSTFLSQRPAHEFLGRNADGDELCFLVVRYTKKTPRTYKVYEVFPEGIPEDQVAQLNVYEPEITPASSLETVGEVVNELVQQCANTLRQYVCDNKAITYNTEEYHYSVKWNVFSSRKNDGGYTWVLEYSQRPLNVKVVWDPNQFSRVVLDSVETKVIKLNALLPRGEATLQLFLQLTDTLNIYLQYTSSPILKARSETTFWEEIITPAIIQLIDNNPVDSLGNYNSFLLNKGCGVGHVKGEHYCYADRDWWMNTKAKKTPNIIRKFLKRTLCPEYFEAALFRAFLNEPKKTCVFLAGQANTAKSTVLDALINRLMHAFDAEQSSYHPKFTDSKTVSAEAPLKKFVGDYDNYYRAIIYRLEDYNEPISMDYIKNNQEMKDFKEWTGTGKFSLEKKFQHGTTFYSNVQWVGTVNNQIFDPPFTSACGIRVKYTIFPETITSDHPLWISTEEMDVIGEEVIDFILSDCRRSYLKLVKGSDFKLTGSYLKSYPLWATHSGLADVTEHHRMLSYQVYTWNMFCVLFNNFGRKYNNQKRSPTTYHMSEVIEMVASISCLALGKLPMSRDQSNIKIYERIKSTVIELVSKDQLLLKLLGVYFDPGTNTLSGIYPTTTGLELKNLCMDFKRAGLKDAKTKEFFLKPYYVWEGNEIPITEASQIIPLIKSILYEGMLQERDYQHKERETYWERLALDGEYQADYDEDEEYGDEYECEEEYDGGEDEDEDEEEMP